MSDLVVAGAHQVLTGAGAKSGRKRLAAILIRLAISAGILFLLLRDADWPQLGALAVRADPFMLVLALVLIVAALLVSALKWQRLVSSQGLEIPTRKLFGYYLVGLFFNNFLPTNIGGDVMRIRDLAKHTGRTTEAVASVVSERLLAALALALTAAIGLLLSYGVSRPFAGVVLAILALTAALTLSLSFKRWRRWLTGSNRLPGRLNLRRHIAGLTDAMAVSVSNRTNFAIVMGLSLSFHVLVAAVAYFIFLSLGVDVPFTYFLTGTGINQRIRGEGRGICLFLWKRGARQRRGYRFVTCFLVSCGHRQPRGRCRFCHEALNSEDRRSHTHAKRGLHNRLDPGRAAAPVR
jgi:uncharacterized protein (TIRG00374 family)